VRRLALGNESGEGFERFCSNALVWPLAQLNEQRGSAIDAEQIPEYETKGTACIA
jgi:hypothetical protein